MKEIKADAREVFRTNLNRFMAERGVDQAYIVSNLGITASTVSDWVNGKKYPRVDAMQRLADLLGVRMRDLTDEPDAQSASESNIPEDKITIFSRNARKLSPEEWEQLQSVARALFKKVFDEDE